MITPSSTVVPTGLAAGTVTVFAPPMLPVHGDLVKRQLARNGNVQDLGDPDHIDLVTTSDSEPDVGLVDSTERPDGSDDSEEELSVTRSETRHAEKQISRIEVEFEMCSKTFASGFGKRRASALSRCSISARLCSSSSVAP